MRLFGRKAQTRLAVDESLGASSSSSARASARTAADDTRFPASRADSRRQARPDTAHPGNPHSGTAHPGTTITGSRRRKAVSRSTLIAALDVGTQKTVCVIARMEKTGLRTIGIGHHRSLGIQAGAIVDAAAAQQMILSAVNAAEVSAGQKITTVSLVMTGSGTTSQLIQQQTALNGSRISSAHLDRLTHGAIRLAEQISETTGSVGGSDVSSGTVKRRLIACDPVEFSVDTERNISDPRGLFADQLSATFHALSVRASAVRTLNDCIDRCLLSGTDLLFGPIAAGAAVLTDEDRELGSLVLDIGAGTTSFSIFHGGHAVYAGCIPLGGSHITRDISQAYAISLEAAERLKTMEGAAVSFGDATGASLSEPRSQEINFGRAVTSKAELVGYIRPRCEEIIELVQERLGQPHLARFDPRRIVLTGGTSQLLGMDFLVQSILNKPVRLGAVDGIAGLPDLYRTGQFASVMGCLKASAGLDGTGPAMSAASRSPSRLRSRSSPVGTQAPMGAVRMGNSNFGGPIGRWMREHF